MYCKCGIPLILKQEINSGLCDFCREEGYNEELSEEMAEQEYQTSIKNISEYSEHSIQRIIFPSKTYAQMSNYCKFAKGEISGLGEIEEIDESSILVKRIVLLKQTCSTTNTKIQASSLNNFTYRMAKKGISLENYKLWWHTHYNFSVFWSSTDEDNIKTLTNFTKSRLYSVVINQMGDMLGRIDEENNTYKLNVAIKNFQNYSKLQNKCRRQVNRLVNFEQPEISSNFIGIPFSLFE